MALTDSAILARVVAEVRRDALGASVRRVLQPRHDLVALELGRADPWAGLVIDWSAETGRLHLVKELPAPGLVDHRLGASLRRHLRGARLEEIEQISFDRVVRLCFSNCEHLGPSSRRTLMCELTGRHGNCVLLDERGQILEAGKHITARVNRYREILPGLAYVPPPQFERLDPAHITAQVLGERAVGDRRDLASWLRGNLHGCSDLFLAEACYRAQLDPAAPLTALPAGWQERLSESVAYLARTAAAGDGAYLYWDQSGQRPELVWPLELGHLAGRRHQPLTSLSVALELLSAEMTTRREMSALRERITSALRQAERRARRVLQVREEAVAGASEAEEDRERGELVMAWLHQVPAGATEVTLPGFAGGEVTVPLDPHLGPLQNAQRYFARYKKARRLRELAPRLLADAEHELDYLAQVSLQVDLAEDVADLQRLEEELVEQGYLKPARRPRPPAPRRDGPRTARTSDGHVLLYGKSGRENDEVLRAAGPDDLWFHVRGAPGAHVVLRTAGAPERVPEGAIYEAATLAARLSSRRSDGRVEVDVARAGAVRKPRGARPGLAYYRAERTIAVDLTREGLQ